MGGFGNSFDQVVGIMTAGTEIMVGMPSQVARGWRTIGANILKVAQSSDTYVAASGKVNIATRKQNGEMKNTYEMMKDLYEGQQGVSKGWKELSKEEQSAIALELAGKQNMEKFRAVMDNFETAINATATAQNSAGSAMKENERYINSMQGSLQNLKSAWSEFSNAMVNGDIVKKVLNGLADVLRILSSDAGQAAIKFAGIALGMNLFAKAILGLKGLSIVKLFSGLGGAFGGVAKGADEATDALKVMQGAQVGAMNGAGKLSGAFMRVGGGLLGPVGLVAAIGLASVALAEYVDIGEKAKDVKITKEFKNAQSDVEKTRQKYKSLNDELDALRQKEKDGTITDSESNRLAILENQTKQLERQLELKKQIAGNKANEYYHTVDPSKLKGGAKDKYTLAKSAGKSDKEALAAAGINDKIALSLNNVRAEADKVSAAQQKVTEAYEKHGKESKQYKEALDNLDKAQEEQGDSLTKLEKKRKKAIEDYGSEKKANKALGKSWKDLNKEIKALQTLKGLDFKKPAKNMQALKKNAKTLGLQFDKTGEKIKGIDLRTFNQKMVEAGYNTEDTWNYLKKLGEENPKLKIDVDGSKVAIEDLEFVDGQIQKIDNSKPSIDIEAKDNASATMDKIREDKDLGNAQKKLEESGGDKVSSVMGTLTNVTSLGSANKSITQSGGSGVSKLLNTLASTTNLGTATKHVNVVANVAMDLVRKVFGLKKGIRHFANGGYSSLFGNAEVNEQGFEIIQDGETGLMRVANGGKRGATYLNEGDSVYTHNQSVRMLRKAGTTEGKAIYGHGKKSFNLFGIPKLEGFAKGLTKKQYNKKYESLLSKYDEDLETLEYQRDKNYWSDNKYIKKYEKLYKKYRKKLKKLNKNKTEGKVNKKKTLGKDRERAYKLAKSRIKHEKKESKKEAKHEAAIEAVGGYIDTHRMTDKELSKALGKIEKARKSKKITAEEADKYRKEAYKKNLEYNLKQYNNDKKTYKDTLKLLKSYYKKGKITSEEYYQYLDELAQSQLEKEKQRLTEQQTKLANTYDLAKAYVQRQIDLLQTENEEQQEQNELIELQNNLAKARNQRIRVYKEGEGFVYEQDTEAIREATQALKDYQSSTTNASEATDPVLAQWQQILKLFDEIEADNAIKQLENAVGSTVGALFGKLGVNTTAWSDWIKNNLSKTAGIQDILDNLDGLVDTNDILNYLNSNGQVSNSAIQEAIANNILPETYAAAITQAALEMSGMTGTGASIATQSAIATMTNGAMAIGNATTYGNIYNFDNLVLPNVTNANDFVNELDNLPNMALQVSTQRT